MKTTTYIIETRVEVPDFFIKHCDSIKYFSAIPIADFFNSIPNKGKFVTKNMVTKWLSAYLTTRGYELGFSVRRSVRMYTFKVV